MLGEAQRLTFHPVASSTDLVPRHVFAGRLFGQELALWRADDGHVNVWENRCLHRGVRLTIGVNLGHELMCQYHGWRYANRTAGCTYIPAHPADAPARTICNRTYPAVERDGLVWAALDHGADPATIPALPEAGLALRPIPLNVPPPEVEAALAEAFAAEPVAFLVQPVDAGRAVIRGMLHDTPEDTLAALRAWNHRLTRLRDRLEALPRAPVQPIPQAFRPVAAELAGLPAENLGRRGTISVRVAARIPVASDVVAFRLAPLKGDLPAFQPGAHLDVHLPNGLVRQYSITNGPDDTAAYVIGVKREPAGKGGSACLHETVREGDVLAVSPPLNNFPLRRDALHTVFVAGGIGLTPLLAMARTLAADRRPFTFMPSPATPVRSPSRMRLPASAQPSSVISASTPSPRVPPSSGLSLGAAPSTSSMSAARRPCWTSPAGWRPRRAGPRPPSTSSTSRTRRRSTSRRPSRLRLPAPPSRFGFLPAGPSLRCCASTASASPPPASRVRAAPAGWPCSTAFPTTRTCI
jgi:nitrite reductase/ring-hydroxylating ferredoxin subunit